MSGLEELKRMLAGEEKRARVHLGMLAAHLRTAEGYILGEDKTFGLGPGQMLVQCAADLAVTMGRVDVLRLAVWACEAKS